MLAQHSSGEEQVRDVRRRGRVARPLRALFLIGLAILTAVGLRPWLSATALGSTAAVLRTVR